MARAPRVFISYSHDSPQHIVRVRDLATALRDAGIRVVLDFDGVPADGWALWAEKEIRDADFVLVVCTQSYCRGVRNEAKPGTRRGTRWEAQLIYEEIYRLGINTRFIPVLFGSNSVEKVPQPLRLTSRYEVGSAAGRAALISRIVHPNSPQLGSHSEGSRNPNSWHLPFERNPFFSGRSSVFRTVTRRLRSEKVLTLWGFGGVGKSQAAAEYAYRSRRSYRQILWVSSGQAGGVRQVLGALAPQLPFGDRLDDLQQEEAEIAAERWLVRHTGWLLILDGIDDLELPASIFRRLQSRGRILATTRRDASGSLHALEIKGFRPSEAVRFLFVRTGRADDGGAAHIAANEIARKLGNLPLALEQAAAFMVQMKMAFADFLKAYQSRRLRLLQHSLPETGSYPESISTTWDLNIQQVRASSREAAELLTLSAYLSPDNIWFDLIVGSSAVLGPILRRGLGPSRGGIGMHRLIQPLAKYSLIRVDSRGTSYSLHPLLQEVIQDRLSAKLAATWRRRVIRCLSSRFPELEYTDFARWSECSRLRPHAMIAAAWALKSPEVASTAARRLLINLAFYFVQLGSAREAEPLAEAAVRSLGQSLHSSPPVLLAKALNVLGEVRALQGRYSLALPLYSKALRTRRKFLPKNDPRVAESYNNLGEAYLSLGHYQRAERLILYGLRIRLAKPELRVFAASSLNNLACVYQAQGRYQEAEDAHRRSLEIRRHILGDGHPHVARNLNNLALVLSALGRTTEAERLHRQALALRRRTLGDSHLDVAASLNNLGNLCRIRGRLRVAQQCLVASLKIRKNQLRSNHPDLATSFSNLAWLRHEQRRYTEAEALFRRAILIREEVSGDDHPYLAFSLLGLAETLRASGRLSEAAKHAQRALEIRRVAYGVAHPLFVEADAIVAKILRC